MFSGRQEIRLNDALKSGRDLDGVHKELSSRTVTFKRAAECKRQSLLRNRQDVSVQVNPSVKHEVK